MLDVPRELILFVSQLLAARRREIGTRKGTRRLGCLADPEARFTDLGPGWHDEQAGRDRKIRSHLRQLKALGIEVTVNPAAA